MSSECRTSLPTLHHLNRNFHNTCDAYTRHNTRAVIPQVLRYPYPIRHRHANAFRINGLHWYTRVRAADCHAELLTLVSNSGRGRAESKLLRTAAGAGASHPFLYPKKNKKNNKINNLHAVGKANRVFPPKSPGLQGTKCPVSPWQQKPIHVKITLAN